MHFYLKVVIFKHFEKFLGELLLQNFFEVTFTLLQISVEVSGNIFPATLTSEGRDGVEAKKSSSEDALFDLGVYNYLEDLTPII